MAEKIKGIDISAWQKGISFDAIKKAGVEFAVIRAGAGKIKDSQLDTFVAECKKRGIKYGFYWYSYALTVDRVKEEAAACIECIKQYKPDYPVAYDQEDQSQIDQLSTRTRTDMAITFCEAIREAGYTPAIYANPSWFESYYKKNELVGKYDIWLACWTENPDKPPRWNYGQRIWQWGLDNIGGYNVDGDLSYYDYTAENSEPSVSENTIEISIGDTVMFKGGSHYVSSTATTATGGARSAGLARVMNIAESAPHKYALRGVDGGSNVYGWVDESLVESVKERLTLGDRVKVKRGAKTYKGGNLASFVYDCVYEVLQIGAGVAPDYIVIGIGGAVTAAVKEADLIKV
ncbi:MAG: glycoside hydrolase family 25 protein [Lachnospiraceae bacterium]|nr:glycoside hydrolase family 25 protein [Lachnospiraceae bacterium]